MIDTSERPSARRCSSHTLPSDISRPVRFRCWARRRSISASVSDSWSFELWQVAGVGREVVAGQARVAALAALERRQQAHPVGQDPVGVTGELDHLVDVGRVKIKLAAVRAELLEAQKLPLVRLWQRVGVAHRHLRGEVAEIALHDVDRHAAVEQLGRPGVAHPVRALKVDQPPVRVADLKLVGKPQQPLSQRVSAIGLGAVAVRLPGDEQIPRRRRRYGV